MSKALMTIHGFLTETTDFGRLYDYVGMYDEVKAVEIPGHNGEKPNFKLFNVKDTFQAVLTVYDDLKSRHDAVDVVGFSMGGALATWLCSVRSVNRAVFVAPANKYINGQLPVSVCKYKKAVKRKAFRETEGKLRDKRAAAKKALAPYRANKKITMKIAKRRTIRYMYPRNFAIFSKIIKRSNVVIETTSPNKTPALILWGRLDELVPIKSVRYLTKHFTNAQVTVYPDVGHAMLVSVRDFVVIRDAVRFLTEGEVILDVPEREY